MGVRGDNTQDRPGDASTLLTFPVDKGESGGCLEKGCRTQPDPLRTVVFH